MASARSLTVVESAIRLATAGRLEPESVLWALAASEVLVLTPTEPVPSPETLQPLIVHRDDQSFAAVFTHTDRIAAEFGAGRAAVGLPASALLRGLAPGIGVVVNPGTPLGFEWPAAGLSAFVALLTEQDAPQIRHFVRYRDDGGAPVPFALLRRRTQDGVVTDEVLKDVDVWAPDRNGSVDRAIRSPLDADLDEIDDAKAREFIDMVAAGSYRPFRA